MRAVHGLGHHLREQGAGRADDDAGDDQGAVAEHVALEADGQAREGVVEADDDGHVGAADGQRHEHAVEQREGEEGDQGEALGAAHVAGVLQGHDDTRARRRRPAPAG